MGKFVVALTGLFLRDSADSDTRHLGNMMVAGAMVAAAVELDSREDSAQ